MPRRPLSSPATPAVAAVTQARWAVSIVAGRCSGCAGDIEVGVRHRLYRRWEAGELMARTFAVCLGCVEASRASEALSTGT